MKIVRLTAENIKKLKAVEITPSGDVVTISGKNGAGKTSVLDSIWWALAGTANIQAQPIRSGETKARIKLDLGELLVERRFTESGSTLTVESADKKSRFSSPQTMLDALLGSLSFDPLAFSRMECRKQFEALRRLVNLPIDFDAIDAANKADYDKRTSVNRDAKELRARLAAISIPVGKPEPVDESALLDELERAGAENTQLAEERAKRQQIKGKIINGRDDAKRLREQADGVDRMVASLEASLEKMGPLAEPIDTEPIRRRLSDAKGVNLAVQQAKSRESIASRASELEAESNRITGAMEAREQQKREAIAAAAMPIEGLGFGDGVVTYGGVPFDQCSSAEQLRVSMSIAMAANPKLRVVRITDGSLLDDDSMSAISKMAAERDYQVWIERVDSSGKVGIVIDDGGVAAVNP